MTLTVHSTRKVEMRRFFMIVALALGLVPAALAAAPVQESIDWNNTRVVPASAETCSFAIQVHSEGIIHTRTYEDGTVKTMLLRGFKIEWTNLETGKTLTSPLGGPAIEYADGTLVINGNNGRLVEANVGYVDVGRTVWTADGLVFAAGQHSEALYPNVCEALA
jgi:hypothetical protein